MAVRQAILRPATTMATIARQPPPGPLRTPRRPELDDECAFCAFEGRVTGTFASVVKGEVIHHCPWHQRNVPAKSRTREKDWAPPSARPYEEFGRQWQ